MTKRASYILLISLVAWVGLAAIVSAAEECVQGFCPLADIGGTKLQGLYDASGEGDLSTFISRVFAFAITAGALMAVLRLTYAGYLYMVTDLWTTKGKAVEIIQSTVLGLFLLLAVYLILWQINPQILSLRILFTNSPGAIRKSDPPPNLAPAGSQYSVYAITVTPQVSTGPNTFEPLSCLVAQGPGWLAVDAQYCGGNLPTGFSCCALDPNYQPKDSTPPPQTIPQEGAGFASVEDIPAGAWCYQVVEDFYDCGATEDSCNTFASRESSVISDCKQYGSGAQ